MERNLFQVVDLGKTFLKVQGVALRIDTLDSAEFKCFWTAKVDALITFLLL